MAIIVVLVGQCGNQLGDELFSQLVVATGLHDAQSSSPNAPRGGGRGAVSPFFTHDGIARCALVDSEPKVVLGVQRRHPQWIRPENVVHGQSGRGNSWGLGYYGVNDPRSKRHEDGGAASTATPGRAFRNLHKGQREEDDNVLTKALRALHAETRRTDDDPSGFEAILLMHSLSGGTGSGLASRLAEKLRLYFVEPMPSAAPVDELYEDRMMRVDGLDGMLVEKRRARHLVSIAVAPQAMGELSTQSINATLTLHVLQKQADAVLLLRNDDALFPGERGGGASPSGRTATGATTHTSSTATSKIALPSSSSSSASSASLFRRCVSFKEANEVLVSLLLPVLFYGAASSSDAMSAAGGREGRPSGASPPHKARDMDDWDAVREEEEEREEKRSRRGRERGGPIAALLRQCAPPPLRNANVTGDNRILTLLPTPQQTYVRFQRAALRCRFFAIYGAKDFLPGCKPEIPLETILAASACAEARDGTRGGVCRNSGTWLPGLPTAANAQRSHATSSSSSPPPRPSLSSLSSVGMGRGDISGGNSKRPRGRAGAVASNRRPSQRDGTARSGFGNEREKEEEDGAYDASDEANQPAVEVAVQVPPVLLRYYREQLRRTPVDTLYRSLEGVAVLNEVKELNEALLFPLLRSAALKTKVGAFLSTYEDVGVTSARIEEAYQAMAAVLSDAEAL